MADRPYVAPPHLGDLTPGRANNVQLLRFGAALIVVLFHCYALTQHWNDEPLYRLIPESNLGLLGVQVFFVLSGFLVTQSWLARPRVSEFAMARALRIYPALVAATLFTVALAGLSSTLAWRDFMAHPQTAHYLWRTATGFAVTDALPGAFPTNPFPKVVNGSLWTLPIELRLYVAVALAGFAALLANRYAWAATVVGLAAVFVAYPSWVPLDPNTPIIRGLALLFAFGSVAFVWRSAIPISLGAAALAVMVYGWNPGGMARGILALPLLAYCVLVAAYHPRLRWSAFNRLGDYSYGTYVYAFPIQQTLARLIPGIAPWELFALALPPTLLLAAVSWHLLERPALAVKSRFPRHRPSA